MTEPETDFYILAWGLVATSVCTSLSRKDATIRLNQQLPTGISSRWAMRRIVVIATGPRATDRRLETRCWACEIDSRSPSEVYTAAEDQAASPRTDL